MATTITQPISTGYTTRKNMLTSFLDWSKAQEYNRLLWVGIGLATHGCIITPLTIMALLFFSNGEVPMVSFTVVVLSMVMVLITNLAALPTKITIPVYALSILADVVVLFTLISL
jgi:hypothetical protein